MENVNNTGIKKGSIMK